MRLHWQACAPFEQLPLPAQLAGGRQLRDMPAFEGARQLAAVIDGLPAAKRIKLAATGALPAALPPLAALPSTTPQGGSCCLLLHCTRLRCPCAPAAS